MYNPKSEKAEEFIDHQEILDTLDYAEKNKQNLQLIESLIRRAEDCKGLTHREAAVLLECNLPEQNEKILKLAKKLRNAFTASV